MPEHQEAFSALPFVLTVTGQGGHSAKPHQTADPIVATAMIIQNLRCALAGEAVQLRFHTIRAGTRHNIIPTKAECEGVLAAPAGEALGAWKARCELLAADVAKAHRTSAVFAFEAAGKDGGWA